MCAPFLSKTLGQGAGDVETALAAGAASAGGGRADPKISVKVTARARIERSFFKAHTFSEIALGEFSFVSKIAGGGHSFRLRSSQPHRNRVSDFCFRREQT